MSVNLTMMLSLWGCEGTIHEPGAEPWHGHGPGGQQGEDRGPILQAGEACRTDEVPRGADVLIDRRPSCGEEPDALSPGHLRHLTRLQLRNTVRDLLGVTSPQLDSLVDNQVAGYAANAGGEIDSLLASQYQLIAEDLANRVDVNALVGCDLEQDSCLHDSVLGISRRALRHPLDADESRALLDLAGLAPSRESAIRWVIEALLQMPSFLYHDEIGDPVELDASLRRLRSVELAARMSYLLWQTMPDEELLAAGEAGLLSEPAERAAQVRRMLSDRRAVVGLRFFFEQWLGIDRLARSLVVDDYPELDGAMVEALREETLGLVEEVVLRGDGTLGTILTSRQSPMTPELSELYGLEPPNAEGMVVAPEGTRAGVLTHGSWLAANGRPGVNPVVRGKLIRTVFLCQSVPPPPEGAAAVEPPPEDEHDDHRRRWCEHSRSPVCAGCHSYLDPLGWPFEELDHLGRKRERVGEWVVDARGAVSGTDVDGIVDGAVGLAERLSQSSQVHTCFVSQWLTFALGRSLDDRDGCAFEALAQRFVDSGGNIRELMVDAIASEAFALRRVGETQ